jgi:coenzyme F420-reducing hydrogenase gamma subunit
MKPRVAFFDFTGCEGCQLEVLNFNTEIVDLINAVDIVEFREASSDHSDSYDVAFIEGSITTMKEIDRVQGIRKNAGVLVALGACACTAGVNALKNFYTMEENLKLVYGAAAKDYKTISARPVHAVVPVDYFIHGCPPVRNEVVYLVKCLLSGKKFEMYKDPICTECKLNENICVYEMGQTCMGPVTRGGCNSICVNSGRHCWGCRGLVDEANLNSEKELLERYGLTPKDVIHKYKIFNGTQEFVKS